MTFEQYQDYVNNYIATNGRNAITGSVMNVILQEIGEMLYNGEGGDITIGTTPIVSGVAGRILFQGADNVVRQSADLHWDTTNNRLGIGTTSPECTLDVRSQGTNNRRGIQVTHYDNTTAFSQAKIIGRRARGSVGSPSAVLANDSIASFNGSGYKETGWSDTLGGMYIYARQNFTDSATGTFITFRGINNGSTTVSEWVRINTTGMAIGWNGTDPGAVLDVRAQGALSTDIVFKVSNSAGTETIIQVRGNKQVVFGNTSSLVGGGFGSSFLSNFSIGNIRVDAPWNQNSQDFTNGNRIHLSATYETKGTRFIQIQNGTEPISGLTDAFKMYSKDIVAGNAAPHFRTENGSIIKLYTQDLPTSPTTGEIATLLSNLGLANLI